MNANPGIRWLGSAILGAALLLALPVTGWLAAGRAPTVGEALSSLPVVVIASELSDVVRQDELSAPIAAAEVPPATTAAAVKPSRPEAIAPTTAFVRQLESAGLSLSADGNHILDRAIGMGTQSQLLLAQRAADRFGIVHNPYFEPRRVAYSGEGENFIDLATGVYTNGQGVASDETLASLRASTGFDLEFARQFFVRTQSFERLIGVNEQGVPVYETYTPAAFQTPEAFLVYTTAARANYLAMWSAG